LTFVGKMGNRQKHKNGDPSENHGTWRFSTWRVKLRLSHFGKGCGKRKKENGDTRGCRYDVD